jgi:ABC-type dipeptide/oligopeptide/nickel transport system permease subunit
LTTPEPESQSLGSIALRRLLRDRNALVGMLLIGIALLVSLLGGTIRPDPSPWANRQVLGIKDQPPGFEALLLKVPRIGDAEPCGIFDRVLFGGCPEAWDPVPIYRYAFTTDSLQLEEFNGYNDLVAGTERRFALRELLPKGVDIPADPVALEELLIVHERFPLGTDSFGRDVLSRLMAGTIISLSVGLIAVLISLLIGIPLGALAGYFRAEAPSFTLFGRRFRWPVDDVIMWLVNVIWSIPTLLLVIAITLALGKGFVQVFIAVGLTMWVEVARIVRGEVIRTREMEYVEAAKALGYTHGRIIFRHILPNVMGPVIVISAANFATAILMEAGLSFLGIGAQLPMVSWGGMIRSYYPYITTDLWHLALLPGVCIMLLTLAFMLVGNALRDALDTRSITTR